MPWLITLIAAPILFFIVTWIVVTMVRLLRRENPVRVERSSTFVHRQTKARKAMAVATRGSSESRDDDDARDEEIYTLSAGWSSGIPNSWHSDLWIRRN